DANKALQTDDEEQLVEVFKEDFSSYDEGTGTLDDSIWGGHNNQVSITANEELKFAPTENQNVRAQTVEQFGDMELTFDFNVESAGGDQGFYIYLRAADRMIEENRNRKSSFEVAINP